MRERRPSERELFEVAAGQAGYFTARHAHAAGYSDALLKHHVDTGRFEHPRRGIYRLRDFPRERFEDLVELQLWAGTGAVLSHETALVVHDLTDLLPQRIHITVPRTTKRRLTDPRIQLHRSSLRPSEAEKVESVSVTTATRTLKDVAGRIESEQFDLAVRQALERGLTDRRKLHAALGAPYGRVWKALRPFVGDA